MSQNNQQLSRSAIVYCIIGILILGTILRMYKLNYQSLWFDELHSIIPAQPENSLQSIVAYCKSDQPPAFFFYLHAVFKIFGYNEIIGRIATAFLGIMAIPVLYLLGKECQNKTTGLFAALLSAACYFLVYYSQELRFYAMTFLFAALSYLFFIRTY